MGSQNLAYFIRKFKVYATYAQTNGILKRRIGDSMQPAHHLNQPTALEKAFHRDMLQIYQRAKEECGYNATRFLQMVANDGGLRTAQKLLDTANPSDGFVELWKNRRLDLSMENLVLNPKYRSLFSQQEIETAKERLNAYGFTPQEE
jgi:hypothetical protein